MRIVTFKCDYCGKKIDPEGPRVKGTPPLMRAQFFLEDAQMLERQVYRATNYICRECFNGLFEAKTKYANAVLMAEPKQDFDNRAVIEKRDWEAAQKPKPSESPSEPKS